MFMESNISNSQIRRSPDIVGVYRLRYTRTHGAATRPIGARLRRVSGAIRVADDTPHG